MLVSHLPAPADFSCVPSLSFSRVSYVLCYGVPLLLCLWLLLTGRLGYSPKNTGWCSILIIDHMGRPDVFIAVLGYDVWIYLAIVMVAVLYLAVHQFIRQKVPCLVLFLPSDIYTSPTCLLCVGASPSPLSRCLSSSRASISCIMPRSGSGKPCMCWITNSS